MNCYVTSAQVSKKSVIKKVLKKRNALFHVIRKSYGKMQRGAKCYTTAGDPLASASFLQVDQGGLQISRCPTCFTSHNRARQARFRNCASGFSEAHCLFAEQNKGLIEDLVERSSAGMFWLGFLQQALSWSSEVVAARPTGEQDVLPAGLSVSGSGFAM